MLSARYTRVGLFTQKSRVILPGTKAALALCSLEMEPDICVLAARFRFHGDDKKEEGGGKGQLSYFLAKE